MAAGRLGTTRHQPRLRELAHTGPQRPLYQMEYRTASHELIRLAFGSAQAPHMHYAAAGAQRTEHLFEVLRVAWIDAEASTRFAVSFRRLHHNAGRAEPGRQSAGKPRSVIEDYVLARSW